MMSNTEQHWASLRENAEESLRKTRRDVAGFETEDIQRLIHELQVHQVELQMQNDDLRLRTHELEAAHTRCQELFDLAPAGYLELDSEGSILSANFAAGALLELDREQLVGKQFETFVDRKHREPLRAHLRASVEKGTAAGKGDSAGKGGAVRELCLSRADGGRTYVLFETHQDRGPSGGCLLALMDVTARHSAEDALQEVNEGLERRVVSRTQELAEQNRLLEKEMSAKTQSEEERKRLAERLREAERLESLGLLAGGIAHDFNNLLVGVLANADLMLREKDLPEDARAALKGIGQAARRAATLTQKLLEYAGRSDAELVPADLRKAILETLELLRASVPPTIQIRTEVGEIPPILADRAQVEQVITNLVINAVEAIGNRPGTVVLRTSCRDLDSEALADYTRTTGARPGRFVVLEVIDTGPGMDAHTLSRVFEPFFSTKFSGRGLGLASVLGILQGHRSAVLVRSEPGQGTTFEIAWPASSTLLPASVPPVLGETTRQTGRVLVIDDDEAVLTAVARQLRHLGFEVVEASGGVEGLRLFREAKVPFSLVVLDRTMPDLSGEQVLHTLREQSPDLPVVLMSGFSAAEGELPREGVVLLKKPMTVAELGAATHTVLSSEK